MNTGRRRRTIPDKDAEFDVIQEIIAKKTMENIPQWHLDQQWMTEKFIPASQQWNMAWENYKDPVTRTQLITFEKNEARKTYEPFLRFLVQNLEYNTYISDDELAEISIYRKQFNNKPVQIPKNAPGCRTSSKGHRNLEFNFFDAETRKKAKPKGVHGIEFRCAILDTLPKDVDVLINSYFSTRTPLTLEFKESDRGKTIYFCVRWENTRGEKGTWSDIDSTIIP
jgi:hypothetical protein